MNIIDKLDREIGFHDSILERMAFDYLKKEAILELNIPVDIDWDEPNYNKRALYRRGQIKIFGLIYHVFEPPYPDYLFSEYNQKKIGLDAVDIYSEAENEELFENKNLPAPLPKNAFKFCILINNWNAFLYFAAMDAEFTWLEPEPKRDK